MNRTEIAQLLAAAAARDRRTVGHADVEAWFTDLGDLRYGEARDALNRHFRESVEWLMPAHIRRLVKLARDESRARIPHETRALPSRFETDAQRATRVEQGLSLVNDVLQPILAEIARRRDAAMAEADPSDVIRQRALARARREKKGRRA